MAFLNMSDPNQNCLSGWKLASEIPVRACTGRGLSRTFECNSAFFSTHQLTYSRVCGRVIGYQHGRPDAFLELNGNDTPFIDGSYVDGVSITHGSEGSRQHIWTFACAKADNRSVSAFRVCDCTSSDPWPYLTGFVGNNEDTPVQLVELYVQ